MIRRAAALVAVVAGAAVAQPTQAVVRDAGPGPIGRYLETTLAKSDTRLLVGDTVTIADTSTFTGSVVVISRHVVASGTVRGDLIVIDGDLFLHPGVSVGGQAIAIGGGVYPTLLGRVEGGVADYRDFTFDHKQVDGLVELRYRDLVDQHQLGRVELPFWVGLRLPRYDRSNGLSVPFGPDIILVPRRLSAEVRGTYRSQLGRVDPSVRSSWTAGRKFWVDGFAGRDSRTNDGWINSDFANSISALLVGRDNRNWYRATVVEAAAHRKFETPTMVATYRLGGRSEQAGPARPGLVPTSAPWSLIKRNPTERMRRPNPQVAPERISSGVGGASYVWAAGDIKANLDVDLEIPLATSNGEHFQQATLDGQIGFPTFGSQRYRLDMHAILTNGDAAPLQRWGYLGGTGTLPTIETPLAVGGDELVYLESRYIIPIERVRLPLVGFPTFTFRHILGAAGVEHLPSLTQLVAFRLSVTLLRAELVVDTKTRVKRFTAGLSLFR